MGETLSEQLATACRPDPQFVTPEGNPCHEGIGGVRIRDLIVHTDERGTLCEMFDPRWNWHPDPIQTCYYYTIRPGHVKGWAVHKLHEDRYCLLQGEMKVVLYDTREGSSSFKKLRVLFLSEQRRQILSIPVGVWHADQAVGSKDVLVVNLPTVPYDHKNPDKYRLPLDTDLIPYDFQGAPGF
jgi:dTDP-4-dehydrorhamnose 3,5-epimerase